MARDEGLECLTMNNVRTEQSSNDIGIVEGDEGKRTRWFGNIDIFDRSVFGEVLTKIVRSDIIW